MRAREDLDESKDVERGLTKIVASLDQRDGGFAQLRSEGVDHGLGLGHVSGRWNGGYKNVLLCAPVPSA
jgi:hypothetical protein